MRLPIPATRNPDGSVLLDVTVIGGGTTKVFNLSALPPDAADRSWRWSSTPDTDLTGGAGVPARSRLTNLTLDMAGATTTSAVASTTAASSLWTRARDTRAAGASPDPPPRQAERRLQSPE